MKADEVTKEALEKLFQTNDAALERAILALYARQTAVERAASATVEHNGVGFSGRDGNFLSSLGKQLTAGRWLSRRQKEVLRRKNKQGFCVLSKYHRQLREIAAAKEAERVLMGTEQRRAA